MWLQVFVVEVAGPGEIYGVKGAERTFVLCQSAHHREEEGAVLS